MPSQDPYGFVGARCQDDIGRKRLEFLHGNLLLHLNLGVERSFITLGIINGSIHDGHQHCHAPALVELRTQSDQACAIGCSQDAVTICHDKSENIWSIVLGVDCITLNHSTQQTVTPSEANSLDDITKVAIICDAAAL